LFEEQVLKTPNHIALELNSETVTYQQLNEKANQLAHLLIENGVKPETLVPICINRSVNMIVGI
jgi:non-ribosomal peptide synthetase component F